MPSYALIKSGTVVNIVSWTGKLADWQPPEGHECIPAGSARIGDFYDGQTFTTPPPPAPVLSEFEQLADLLRAKNIITQKDRDDLRAKGR